MKKYLLIAAIAGGVALLFAAAGTSTLTFAPKYNLRLVESIVCSPGQTLDYQELDAFTYTDAEGTHTQQNISIACVSANGNRVEGKSTVVIGLLMAFYFLLCFVPLFGVGILWLKRVLRPSRRTSF